MATLVDPFKYSTCPRCGGGLLTESFLVASETGWTSLGPDRLRSTDLGEALEASAGLFAGRTIPAGLPILVCPNCVKELAEQAVVSDLMNAQGLSEAEARELAPYLSRIRSGNVSISRQQTPAVAPRGGDTALHTLVQRIHFRSPRALIEWEAAFAKIVRLCETGVSVHALNAKGATALWALLDIDDFRFHESEYLFDEIGWYGDDRDFAGRVFDWRRVFETRTRFEIGARLLLAFGADLASRHPDTGETLLTHAAVARPSQRPHTVAVALLLQLGADPSAKNALGGDAFGVAGEAEAKVLRYWRERQGKQAE